MKIGKKLKRRSKRGFLITLEGPEGAGKSTQGRRLAAWLRANGVSPVTTREPGGTVVGEGLRKILLKQQKEPIDSFVEFCLYEASRAVLVQEVILPALKKGKVVIVDRFQDSTWTYQGWAGDLDLKLIEQVGRLAMAQKEPDLTLLLDCPVQKGLNRVKRPNRFEAKPIQFHRKVRAGFLKLAKRYPKRIKVIDASAHQAVVQQQVREVVKNALF